MKTTATNRKIRVLMTAIKAEKLIPRPEFQRRLVWSKKDKSKFIQTVLMNYPFPEIYIAAGDVDVDTGEGTEMLVDGQQRVTTLKQYFTGDDSLKLDAGIRRYAELSPEEKAAFLEYEVVVRDLGAVPIETIKEVFQRINSTKYALTAMEIHNARFDGEFKQCGDEVAAHPFFEKHSVFSLTDVKRMQDTRYCLTIIATMMGGYFNRDDDLEGYLSRYNDEFSEKDEITQRIEGVLTFIGKCRFDPDCRIFKKNDLFTAIVELDEVSYRLGLRLNRMMGAALGAFYKMVDARGSEHAPEPDVERYYLATIQASNDRKSRVTRGEIIRNVIMNDSRRYNPDLFPEEE
jgi:hypothetical protein